MSTVLRSIHPGDDKESKILLSVVYFYISILAGPTIELHLGVLVSNSKVNGCSSVSIFLNLRESIWRSLPDSREYLNHNSSKLLQNDFRLTVNPLAHLAKRGVRAEGPSGPFQFF